MSGKRTEIVTVQEGSQNKSEIKGYIKIHHNKNCGDIQVTITTGQEKLSQR